MPLDVYSDIVELSTDGLCDIKNITDKVGLVIDKSGVTDGLVTVFCQGSTAAVTIIEFEPGVIHDLREALEKIAPSAARYHHDESMGDGNGFSHVRAALMKPDMTIPIVHGKMQLGRWQQVVLIDFDNRPRDRKIVVSVMGIK